MLPVLLKGSYSDKCDESDKNNVNEKRICEKDEKYENKRNNKKKINEKESGSDNSSRDLDGWKRVNNVIFVEKKLSFKVVFYVEEM